LTFCDSPPAPPSALREKDKEGQREKMWKERREDVKVRRCEREGVKMSKREDEQM